MNRENIQRVRDVIAALPDERFTMQLYAASNQNEQVSPLVLPHNCNTAGCIAGWTVAALSDREPSCSTSLQAAILLDLTVTQADQLFMPTGFERGRYTRAHAVHVLDRLLKTGKVDWRDARETPAAQP